MNKVPLKSREEIALMQEACDVTVKILDELEGIVRSGMTTDDINTYVDRRTRELGATPSTLGYKGYPKSCCTSPNEIICHGIPSPFVVLKDGDIINIDCTSFKNGFHGDSSRMFFVGGRSKATKEAQHVVDIAQQCLYAGIRAVRVGGTTGDIGAAIMELVEKSGHPYGIVREYTGHGVGRQFHEPLQITHVGKRGFGEKIKAGMTFTVEPMINVGSHKTQLSRVDGWTVRTADGSLSAQWEHTLYVHEDGIDILTLSAKEKEAIRRGELTLP